MSKKHDNLPEADDIQLRFDTFAKRTISKIVDSVLSNYVDEYNRRIHELNIDDFADIPASVKIPDIEKIKMPLGTVDFYVENILLAEGIGTLSEKYKQILGYAYAHDLSNREIAALMGLEYKTIRNLKSRVYELLRKYISEHEE